MARDNGSKEDIRGDIQESSLLLKHSRQGTHSLEDALFSALQGTELDLIEEDPPLYDFLNMEALRKLNWENPTLDVRTSVWGYPIRITPDYIYIYFPDPS